MQEILKLTGDLNPMGCLENGGKPCSRSKDCRTRPVWDKLNTLLNDYLKGVTIKDLMKE